MDAIIWYMIPTCPVAEFLRLLLMADFTSSGVTMLKVFLRSLSEGGSRRRRMAGGLATLVGKNEPR